MLISEISADNEEHDLWADWILHRRNAGSPGFKQRIMAEVERYADRVLDAAQLQPGMTLVDVGCGDGFLGLHGIKRIGPTLHVIFTDISARLLKTVEEKCIRENVREQCTFFIASAENLSAIVDQSVDVVATRSALAYVHNKPAALREFWRILKPGAKISFAEPIFQDEALSVGVLRAIIESNHETAKNNLISLIYRLKSAQFPSNQDQMEHASFCNFSERDLLRMIQEAGFHEAHLELHIDVHRSLINSWDEFIGRSPHPLAPSLQQVMEQSFSVDDQKLFESVIRPAVESKTILDNERIVYLTATKYP